VEIVVLWNMVLNDIVENYKITLHHIPVRQYLKLHNCLFLDCLTSTIIKYGNCEIEKKIEGRRKAADTGITRKCT
jgi:hypothetical protein